MWGAVGAHCRPHTSTCPTECRDLLLRMAVPVLQDLIERGEEEDACVELLSTILEVLYMAQKVLPRCSAGPCSLCWLHLGNTSGCCSSLGLLWWDSAVLAGFALICSVCCREQRRTGTGSAATRSW